MFKMEQIYIQTNKDIILLFNFSKNRKIFFMYLPRFKPLFDYQKKLIQNCESISQADYVIMDINSYFRNNGYIEYKWNSSFLNLVLSKKIIAMSEEDVNINFGSFNFKFWQNITAFIGGNDERSQKSFFRSSKVFTHLIFGQYVENHNSSYYQFIKRPFYIQTAISNSKFMVNSKRTEYLRKCMDFFGNDKIANYGLLFRNQNYVNNSWLSRLPPSSYFGFSIENSIADYRIAEKLFMTYRNDVIPIYRGSVKNINFMKKYGINTKSFIDASNMNVTLLINHLNDLINDKKKMFEIYRQPLIPNKTFFDQKIKEFYNKLTYKLDKYK